MPLTGVLAQMVIWKEEGHVEGMNSLWWFTRLRITFLKDDTGQQLGPGKTRAGQGQTHQNTFLM